MILTLLYINTVMVQGSRTCTSICCTTNQHLTSTNPINHDEATFQSSRITLSQTNSMHRHDCHVTSNLMSTAIVTLRKQNKPCKEEDKLHPRKISKSGHNTRKHYRMFLCLSHSVVCIRFKALSRHACNA